MARIDGRANDEIRPVIIKRNYLKHPEGSVLICTGDTRVICTATVEESVPSWLNGSEQGWVTAEYGMLPRATNTRTSRNRVTGRSQEIQRLIGRSLRQAVDLSMLTDIQIKIDCDVIQADGGTRTASITGAYIALVDAIDYLLEQGIIVDSPILGNVAAISVGIVHGEVLLDLSYVEDSVAQVDMNIVMRDNTFVEVQGTGEESTFTKADLDEMLRLAEKGISELIEVQNQALTD